VSRQYGNPPEVLEWISPARALGTVCCDDFWSSTNFSCIVLRAHFGSFKMEIGIDGELQVGAFWILKDKNQLDAFIFVKTVI